MGESDTSSVPNWTSSLLESEFSCSVQHPDKFMPKYAAFIAEDEREAIQEAVTKTFRCLKRYSDKLEEA